MKKLIVIIIILIFKTACSQKNNENWESEKRQEVLCNKSVIKSLQKNGDKLIVAREVFHWIYFKSF